MEVRMNPLSQQTRGPMQFLLPLLTLWALTWFGSTALPQQVVSKNPCALEHSQPWLKIERTLPRDLIPKLQSALTKTGFTKQTNNLERGTIDAWRTLPDQQFDRVILYLERDFQRPEALIWLSFDHGRYASGLGTGTQPSRIRIDQDESEVAMKDLTAELVILGKKVERP